MVTPGAVPLRNRRGASRMGCLFMLLIAAFIGYYGVTIGGVYLQYWRLEEEMRSQARLAPSIDDQAIQRRLLRKMDELNIPDEARRRLSIRRLARPREIRIRTEYQQILELPFVQYTLTLTPEARQPL